LQKKSIAVRYSIAYIAQTFPALTQTFVYREIQALQKQGFEVMTSAIWKPKVAALSEESRHWVEQSLYVFPLSWSKFIWAHLSTFLKYPGRYIKTLAFIFTQRGESTKKRLRTLGHFWEAISLVPAFEKRHVAHIHAHFTINAATIALVLSRVLDISFSFTAHNIFFTDRILLREKVRQARFIVAISEFSKQRLLQLTASEAQAEKVHIIHCGLSPENFAPPDAKLENEAPLLLFVAQLAERKGAPFLIEACKILKAREIPFHCVVVGGGEIKKQQLASLVTACALQDTVELTGALPQEELRPYLDRTDIFVLPCITASDGDMDGIPVSLMEAMAMEIPPVSTYVSGIPELIEDGQSGLLVPEKDATALADALQALIQDKALRLRLGKHARQKVVQDFDVRKSSLQLANLFEMYLSQPERR
jgi:colanic acid/amylovoran biosynthesis glycosyltransferase